MSPATTDPIRELEARKGQAKIYYICLPSVYSTHFHDILCLWLNKSGTYGMSGAHSRSLPDNPESIRNYATCVRSGTGVTSSPSWPDLVRDQKHQSRKQEVKTCLKHKNFYKRVQSSGPHSPTVLLPPTTWT